MGLLVRVEDVDTPAVTLTAASASATGDTYPNDEHTYLVVDNASGSSITATITKITSTVTPPGRFGPITLADKVITILAGARAHITAPPSIYNSSAGVAEMKTSLETSVTIQARRRAPE